MSDECVDWVRLRHGMAHVSQFSIFRLLLFPIFFLASRWIFCLVPARLQQLVGRLVHQQRSACVTHEKLNLRPIIFVVLSGTDLRTSTYVCVVCVCKSPNTYDVRIKVFELPEVIYFDDFKFNFEAYKIIRFYIFAFISALMAHFFFFFAFVVVVHRT